MNQNAKQGSRVRKSLFLTMAVCLFTFGIFLTVENTMKFYSGYQLATASSEETPISLSNKVKDIGQDELTRKNQELYTEKPAIGETIGELIIPKINAKLPIVHGTNEEELEKGVGHFAGSVLPGENDNSVLAGHRDTVFRKLGEVGIDDQLIVKTTAGTFVYQVREVRIVDSNDRTVIVPMPKTTLTVSTCYPFTFIGPAPKRYVLVADLIAAE